MNKQKRNNWILLALILAGESIFFLPFVMARVFRPTLLEVMQITNLELGAAFSAYGIVAVVSYFFGGPLADRFPARNLIATALIATAVGGLFLITIPSSTGLTWLYGFWGFTTIFLFWAALIRSTREWGGRGFQGRAFGFLEGGRGLTAAIIGTIALAIFSGSAGDGDATAFAENRESSYQWVIISVVAITLFSAIMVLLLIPKTLNKIDKRIEKHTAKAVIETLKLPAVWLNAIIIICAYVGYKITDDFSLYANQVLGFNEVESAGVGTTALWLRPVFAISAGLLADKFKSPLIVIYCFAAMVLGGLFIWLDLFQGNVVLTLVILAAALAGVYGIRGIYFALLQDAKIPIGATGIAVGIISVVGYTPDIFMSPLMGYLLDNNPGAEGHKLVFALLMLFGVVGFVAAFVFKKFTSSRIT